MAIRSSGQSLFCDFVPQIPFFEIHYNGVKPEVSLGSLWNFFDIAKPYITISYNTKSKKFN